MEDIRLKKFVEYLRLRNYTKRTLETYSDALRKFFHYLNVKRPDRATARQVQAFLETLRKLSPSTRACIQTAISTYYKMLLTNGLVLVNPVEGLRRPIVRNGRKPKTIPPEEVERIISIPDIRTPVGLRNRAILEVFYATAIRRNELLALSVLDVDLDEGFLWVRKGKGLKDRKVPLGKVATAWLKRYLQSGRPLLDKEGSSSLLFLGERRNHMAISAIRDLFIACAKAAGVKRTVTPHMFRHTTASEMLRNGAALRHIQELLGHASLQSTQVYTRVAPSGLSSMILKCHPSVKSRVQAPRWKGRI